MQENNFLLCLRNPCENTFLKLQIYVFFKKKEIQKDVRVLAVCNTQENIFLFFSDTHTHTHIYIYIYLQHFVEKPGILIPDLYFHK